MQNNIYVYKQNDTYILDYPRLNIKTKAFIGKEGLTNNKCEGDLKTPRGEFFLGIKMSLHDLRNCLKITDDMYWVDDSNSEYYNQLVKSDMKFDWRTAEHLIDYKDQYEYLIEIKANKDNIPGKGSAIFLHCSNGEATSGCIAVDKTVMQKLIENVDKTTKIIIKD